MTLRYRHVTDPADRNNAFRDIENRLEDLRGKACKGAK
jgi:hypothetical protein